MDEVPKDVLKSIFDKVNREDTFSKRIGVKLVELLPGFARTTLSITDETINIYQMAHGGAIFSTADQACEAAGTVLENQLWHSNKIFNFWLPANLETSLRPRPK